MEYFLQPKEVDGLRFFLRVHATCWPKANEKKSNTSLEFTQTGIGVATVVKCRSCDQEENITDYSTW